MKKFIAIAIISTLGACQSTTNPSTSNDLPPVNSVGAMTKNENGASNVEITFDPATNTVVTKTTYSDGSSYVYNAATKTMSNGIRKRESLGNAYSVAGATASGSGAVSIGSYRSDTISLQRFGSSDLPTTGTAKFDADYAAVFIENGKRQPGIVGNATVHVDFKDGEVWGRVTDRHVEGQSSSRFEDIRLKTGSVADGEFFGTSQGGGRSGTNYTDNGTYTGLITGSSGNEMVGAVKLDHSTTGKEYGVFVSK